jgi:REP element-mobilizing transposase RayT
LRLAQGSALGQNTYQTKPPCKGKSNQPGVTPCSNININMAQSLCKIYLHIIFHIKTGSPEIENEHLPRLHQYIGSLVNSTGCQVLCVGGIGNHVHVLLMFSKTESVAHVVEEMKRNSSRWVKTLTPKYDRFAWQGGYAAFSVSQSVVEKTRQYVMNQTEHHKKVSFRDEYISFLKLYNIEYDEKYVFSD